MYFLFNYFETLSADNVKRRRKKYTLFGQNHEKFSTRNTVLQPHTWRVNAKVKEVLVGHVCFAQELQRLEET